MLNIFKVFLLLALFAPALCFAFKQKKWYLFLVCTFVGILPDRFAIEFSSSLPLLTAERILILFLFGVWLWKKWKEKTFVVPVALLIYGGINVLISVLNFHFGIAEEIKRIAILMMENVLLVIMLAEMIESKEEIDKCIDSVILGCCALAVMGIIQTIFNFDITTVLNITEARSAMTLTHRMGMTRAYGTSNAIIFGCYCTFISLLIYYRMEKTGKIWYSFAFALDVAALICTFSRSSWLCFLIAGFALLVLRPRKLLHNIWRGGVVAATLCIVLTFFNFGFSDAFIETGKSTLNTMLAVVNMEIPMAPDPSQEPEDAIPPELLEPDDDIFQFEISDKFGLNANNAALSRFVEWTSLLYMFEDGHGLLGYGYNAFLKGRLHYFYPQFGFWTVASTLDVGLLRIVTECGILGLIAHMSFFAFVFISALRRREKDGTMCFNTLVLYLIPIYLMLNFVAAFNSVLWVIVGLFYAYKRVCKKETKDRELLTLSLKQDL